MARRRRRRNRDPYFSRWPLFWRAAILLVCLSVMGGMAFFIKYRITQAIHSLAPEASTPSR